MKQYLLTLCLILGSSLSAQFEYQMPYAEELLAQIEQAETDAEKIPLLINLSFTYEESDLENFKKYAEQAIKLSKKLGNDHELAAAYSNVARYHSYTGAFDKAIDHFMLALKHADVSKDGNLLYGIRGSLGNTYFQMEQYVKAKEHYEYAEKLAYAIEVEHQDFRIAAILTNIGNVHVHLKEYDKAEGNYNKALALFRVIGYDEGLADALVSLNELHVTRDQNWDKGFIFLEQALELHKEIKYPRNKAHILNNLAAYYSHKNDYDKAIAYAEQMITLSKEINAPDLTVIGEETLFGIYADLDDHQKALAGKESSQELKNSMFNEATVSKIVAIETQLKTQEKEQQISTLDAELGKSTTRQKYIALLGLCAVLLISLVTGFIYQQKRHLKYRFISIHEENEILKQSNLSLKDRLLEVADRIERTRSSQPDLNTGKYYTSSLKKEEKQHYMNFLLDIMEQKKTYLNADLRLSELADMLSINSHQLSELLNETIGKNFYEFINTYRIEEAKTIMNRSDTQNKTLLTIAFDAGFNNKASFYRAFKKITGTTPSNYKKELIN